MGIRGDVNREADGRTKDGGLTSGGMELMNVYKFYNKICIASGIRIETLQLIYYSMSENTRHKALPEVYACSTECCMIPYRSGDDQLLKKYNDVVGDYKKKNITRETFRNFVLLLCHMNRIDDLPDTLKLVQKEILKYSMIITQCMLDVCICKGWLLTIKSILDFRRCIIHGLSNKNEMFLQIPHFNYDIINHIHKGKNSIKYIEDYIILSPEEQRGTYNMSNEQLYDIKQFCNIFPRIEMNVKLFVTDEQDIYLNDLITVNIIFNRINLQDNESCGAIHAPYFPWIKYEEWSLVINYKDEDKTIAYTIINNREKKSEHNLQFIADRIGNNTIVVSALCDSYFGCDKSINIDFNVKPPIYNESKIHPDDIALDNEPSAIGKIFGELLTQNDESDEEEIIQCNEY